jgi:AraC-like DNA-binding protein
MICFRSNVEARDDLRGRHPTRSLGWLDARKSKATPGLIEWAAEAASVKELIPDASWRFANLGREVCSVAVEFDRPSSKDLRKLSDMIVWLAPLPVIVFSEYHAEDLAVWAFRSGAADFIVTPLSRTDLTAIVQNMTTRRESSHATRCTALAGLMAPPRLPPFSDVTNIPSAKRTGIAATYILRHFGARITERDMAELCHMSVSEFSRAFHKENRFCFREFLLRRRLQAAASLLAASDSAIADIAFEVGFGDPTQLSRHFRQFYAATPTEYRIRQKRASESEKD